MALEFNASTERVSHGSGSSIDDVTAGTVLFWAYSTTASDTDMVLCEKGAADTFGMRGNVEFNLFLEYGRATSNLDVRAAFSNFSVWGANKWVFIAGTYDTGGANGDQKLYMGDLTTRAAEPSAYGGQSVGSGTLTSNASNNLIVGNWTSFDRNWPGYIACFRWSTALLTEGEIWAQQFAMASRDDFLIDVQYGVWGTGGVGTQVDLSGNGNNGTITGATKIAHPPIRLFPARALLGHASAPAAPAAGAIMTPNKGFW